MKIPIPKPVLFSLALALVLSATSLAGEAPRAAGSGEREKTVTVMTQNLYLGAEVAPVIQAALTDSSAIPAAVSEVWGKVQATDFPERAHALAVQIDRARPDLIGLQEAVLYRSQFPADSLGPAPTPATRVEYDFVELLRRALLDRGLRYEVVAVSTGFDVELPRVRSLDPLELEDIRLTEREVILARAERHSALKLSNVEEGSFETNLDLGFLVVRRGWAAVDVKIRGERFRFITTHLEADDEHVRVAQSNELLRGPANTRLPVVLLGDFNSNANGDETSAAYLNLLSGGFRDSWSEVRGGEAGSTCCHDELLVAATPFAAARERIDLVLLRGDIEVESVDVVGEEQDDRTPSGLWPSDHAGVVAKLRLK
ncbi:MAG TPA: endonuclease/exonuclease/phosphatase family protein [Thermoanaerobaculia bacterium]|nr:endonuclease/exonuclease/phosphatase family protein [Thermoanaerobaculia bacterium]